MFWPRWAAARHASPLLGAARPLRQKQDPHPAATVTATFRTVALNGDILAAFQMSKQNVRSGEIPRAATKLVEAFLKEITAAPREIKYSLYYDSDETKAAAYMLKAAGPLDPVPPENLKPIEDILNRRLTQYPDDHCAQFLMGVVNELRLEWAKAKEYYNKALLLHPSKKYSEALERVMQVESRIKRSQEQRESQQVGQEPKEPDEEFKDYEDLLRK